MTEGVWMSHTAGASPCRWPPAPVHSTGLPHCRRSAYWFHTLFHWSTTEPIFLIPACNWMTAHRLCHWKAVWPRFPCLWPSRNHSRIHICRCPQYPSRWIWPDMAYRRVLFGWPSYTLSRCLCNSRIVRNYCLPRNSPHSHDPNPCLHRWICKDWNSSSPILSMSWCSCSARNPHCLRGSLR